MRRTYAWKAVEKGRTREEKERGQRFKSKIFKLSARYVRSSRRARRTMHLWADKTLCWKDSKANIALTHKIQEYRVNTRSSAVAVIADRTACKFAVRTPLHMHWSRHSAVSAHVSAVAPNGTVPIRGRTNAVKCVLGLRCASFFVVRFMAKRWILEQKCQKGQIGTLMLGTRWYNF